MSAVSLEKQANNNKKKPLSVLKLLSFWLVRKWQHQRSVICSLKTASRAGTTELKEVRVQQERKQFVRSGPCSFPPPQWAFMEGGQVCRGAFPCTWKTALWHRCLKSMRGRERAWVWVATPSTSDCKVDWKAGTVPFQGPCRQLHRVALTLGSGKGWDGGGSNSAVKTKYMSTLKISCLEISFEGTQLLFLGTTVPLSSSPKVQLKVLDKVLLHFHYCYHYCTWLPSARVLSPTLSGCCAGSRKQILRKCLSPIDSTTSKKVGGLLWWAGPKRGSSKLLSAVEIYADESFLCFNFPWYAAVFILLNENIFALWMSNIFCLLGEGSMRLV